MRNTIRILKNITKNDYFFSVVAKLLGVVIMLGYSVVINRYLGSTLKGESSIISNYYQIIVAFICVGMYQAYPFYRKKEENIFYEFINNIISLYFVLFCTAILVLVFSHNIPISLRIAIVLSPLFALTKNLNYVVTIEYPKRRNISSIVIDMVDLAFVLLLFIFSNSTYSLMVFVLFVQITIEASIALYNLRLKRQELRFTLKSIPKYASFGFLPMITLLLMTINYRVDVLMLKASNCITMSQIGIYSVGVMLSEKVWLIPDAIKDILLSKLCKGKGELEVARVIRINLFVIIGLIILIALVCKPVISLMYGAEYDGAGDITMVMLLGVLGMIFYKMVYSYNVSLGRRGINLLYLGIAAGLNIVGNYVLIPKMGILGAAITSVFSYNVCGLCFLLYFYRISEIPLRKILFIQHEDIDIFKRILKN